MSASERFIAWIREIYGWIIEIFGLNEKETDAHVARDRREPKDLLSPNDVLTALVEGLKKTSPRSVEMESVLQIALCIQNGSPIRKNPGVYGGWYMSLEETRDALRLAAAATKVNTRQDTLWETFAAAFAKKHAPMLREEVNLDPDMIGPDEIEQATRTLRSAIAASKSASNWLGEKHPLLDPDKLRESGQRCCGLGITTFELMLRRIHPSPDPFIGQIASMSRQLLPVRDLIAIFKELEAMSQDDDDEASVRDYTNRRVERAIKSAERNGSLVE